MAGAAFAAAATTAFLAVFMGFIYRKYHKAYNECRNDECSHGTNLL